MLQIKNLSIYHRKDLRPIVENFSFFLNPGDKAVIIGEEGNGKSTLLKLIYDEELVADYARYEGEILRGGLRMGYLAQELSSAKKEKTVYEFLSEIPAFYEKSPKELAAVAVELGISQEMLFSDQKMGTLSGGEKVKMQLAGLLLEAPDVFLLDEPSNDIDIETLEWLERFINRSTVPVLFVSHDETLIENTANIVIHLEQLRRKTVARHTVARMSYRTYVTEREIGMERQEQRARKERSEYEKQMEKYRQIEQRVEHEQRVITRQAPGVGAALKKKMHTVKSMGRRFEREKDSLTQMPETEEAIFSKMEALKKIPNGKRVLEYELEELRAVEDGPLLAEHIFLRLMGPEKICIVGRNGAGKTTLLKRMAKELLGRDDISAAYMPQDYEEMFLERERALGKVLTPEEFLAKTGEKEELTRIRTYLGSMKYTADEMEHSINELSGGQKAKLLFLKMSMDGSNVLILDEPTRNFSPLSGPVIRRILKKFDGVIISISHDRKYIEEVCGTVYRLEKDGLKKIEKQ